MLQKLVYYEARGEDEKGQILVINVVLNRLKSNRFPNTIKEVVYQPRQFEPVGIGLMDKEMIPTERNKIAVQKALDGVDYSDGALFFRTGKGAEGSWHETSLHFMFEHGCHRFYS